MTGTQVKYRDTHHPPSPIKRPVKLARCKGRPLRDVCKKKTFLVPIQESFRCSDRDEDPPGGLFATFRSIQSKRRLVWLLHLLGSRWRPVVCVKQGVKQSKFGPRTLGRTSSWKKWTGVAEGLGFTIERIELLPTNRVKVRYLAPGVFFRICFRENFLVLDL